MAGFVAIGVGEGGKEIGIGGDSLGGDEELIHGHGGIEGDGHSGVVL